MVLQSLALRITKGSCLLDLRPPSTQSLSISSLVGDLASCGRALPRCIAWCSGSIVAESDVRPTEENVACGALIASGMRCCAMQVDVCRCLRARWAVTASSTYSHGDYRSHGGWYTLVTTTNLSKSSQNGCHWTASSLKKRKRSTCLQEGGLGLRLAPSPDNTIMEIRGSSAAQMAVSCCATANLKDWLSNQGNA